MQTQHATYFLVNLCEKEAMPETLRFPWGMEVKTWQNQSESNSPVSYLSVFQDFVESFVFKVS